MRGVHAPHLRQWCVRGSLIDSFGQHFVQRGNFEWGIIELACVYDRNVRLYWVRGRVDNVWYSDQEKSIGSTIANGSK